MVRWWTYTVGRSSGFAHPELVIVGGPFYDGAAALNQVGELIRGGTRFVSGDEVEVERERVRFGDVHPVHLARGLMAFGDEYHRAVGRPACTGRALQVVPVSGPVAQGAAPHLLSDATVRLDHHGSRPANRAERRARRRR